MTTLAKPIAGGIPLGAILCTEEAARAIHAGMHGTTFGGGPLACAVAIAVIDAIENEDLLEHATEVGDYFQQQLRGLAKKHDVIKDVRGKGLMLAAELDSADLAKLIVDEMLKHRIMINRTSDTVLRFLPPYILERRACGRQRSRRWTRSYRKGRGCERRKSDRRRKQPWLAEQPMERRDASSSRARRTRIFWPRLRALAGEDLCSIADLSSGEVRAIVKLGHDVEDESARISACARREADGADV